VVRHYLLGLDQWRAECLPGVEPAFTINDLDNGDGEMTTEERIKLLASVKAGENV